MDKIIFLDIDGVLNVNESGRDRFGRLFHKQFENNLGYIIEQTGAKIVISSSWRMSGLKIMQEMWKERQIPGEVIGITPFETYVVENETGKFYDSISRGEEIQLWIDKHNVTNYVIIDDNIDEILESQKNKFVNTSGNMDHKDCVDAGYGLTRECAIQAVEILCFGDKEIPYLGVCDVCGNRITTTDILYKNAALGPSTLHICYQCRTKKRY